jgi:heme-degrading monooxygenase HmoA
LADRPPDPPYIAVIFTSVRSDSDPADYDATAARMEALARDQDGYLGHESARGADGLGITVSYWRDEASIAAWRAHVEHADARAKGRATFYQRFSLRVGRVDRQLHWTAPTGGEQTPND